MIELLDMKLFFTRMRIKISLVHETCRRIKKNELLLLEQKNNFSNI
jgi:hypothetical protein